jgi:hypothetical protein
MKLSTGQTATKTPSIIGGQYDSPVTEWIFPEVITPGAAVPELDYSQFPFLINGPGVDADGNVFHQLNPWPGATKPTPSKTCPDHVIPPITPGSGGPTDFAAFAANNTSARPGVAVQFVASQNNASLPTSEFSFAWTQLEGTAGTLTGASSATVTFAAKAPQTPATLRDILNVVVTHVPSGVHHDANVTLTADNSLNDHVVVDTYTFVNKQGGTINVVAHSDLVADPNAKMTLTFGGRANAMTSVGPGQWSFNARSTAKPASITVTSSTTVNGVTKNLDSKTLTATTA